MTITNDGLAEGEDPFRELDPRNAEPAAEIPFDEEMPGLLPEEFWKEREIFQHIRDAAHARLCSGDVAFWATMARLSGMVSHKVRAETLIGDPASLNLFVAVVGPPGAGKSTSAAISRRLMDGPEDFLDGLPIGTGQGMCEIFMGEVEEDTGRCIERGPNRGDPVMTKVRKQVAHNAYFYVDEGGVLGKQGSGDTSVLYETIRSAAVGGTIGQTNASADRRRRIEADSYSMGMLIGFQPVTALPLLADWGTGTPQRFIWSWVIDPHIPRKRPAHPGKITGHLGAWRPTADVLIAFPPDICQMLEDDLRERRSNPNTEETSEDLDGHAGLIKVKVAALLAILDKRMQVTDDDWRIAEMLWANSCLVRDSLAARAKRESEAARKAAEDAAVSVATRIHEATAGADRKLESLAVLIRQHVGNAGIAGITWGAVRKLFASRDRPLLEKAIEIAVAKGWVVEIEERFHVPVADA